MASTSPPNVGYASSASYDTTYKYEQQYDQPIPRGYPEPPDIHAQYAPPPQQQEAQALSPSDPTKVRLRKACDSCSVRKVKCDEAGPPCKSCAALEIPCTFNRPSRRRGPPNRHAEAIKRQKISEDGTYTISGSSPTHDAAYSLAALSAPVRLSAESICDIETLSILIDDYFTYIHPLVPIPHEPTFRAAFARRDDRTDHAFLALLAAMMETLVASFPRRPRQLFTSEQARKQFPNAGVLIDRCHQVFNEARGIGHLDKQLTLYDAASSYLAGLAAAYVFDMVRIRLYFGECVMTLRTLNFHQRPHDYHDPTLGSPGPGLDTSKAQAHNYIDREVGCRIFWLCFVGCMSLRQLGVADADVLMPPLSHAEKLPQMPLEIDDEHIFESFVNPQPPGVVSSLTGFNLNVLVFRAFHALTALEMAFGTDELYDWERQRSVIRQALVRVKAATAGAPPELRLAPSEAQGAWPPSSDSPSAYTHLFNGRQDPMSDVLGLPPPRKDAAALPYPKRAVQYEIQKANIYASQLATRSYLVEKFWNLYEIKDRHSAPTGRSPSANSPTVGSYASGVDYRIHPSHGRAPSDGMDVGEQAMSVEREDIVRDMAVLLRSINQVNMEPNGLSFCHKIRQVASTLLHTPRSMMATMPTLDTEATHSYLVGFLEILSRLERLGPSRLRSSLSSDVHDGNKSTEELEEEELVHWASLKAHQERFVKVNGFISEV